MNMFEDMLALGVNQGDPWPVIYVKRGWWIRPIRWGAAKKDDANIRGRLPATNDPAAVAAYRLQIPGCSWSLECGRRSGVVAADIEQRVLKGEDGVLEMRRLGERLGLRESLIPLGLTPIYSTRSGGLRILYAHPGYYVHSGLLQGCKYVEIKADNSSVRLPPGGGYAWDSVSHFALKLAPMPAWMTVMPVPTIRSREALLPEGELGERQFTPLGHQIAKRIAKAAESSTSTPEACRRVRSLGRLVAAGKITEAFGERVVEHLAETLPDFDESGFNRARLLPALRRSFVRSCHGQQSPR
jgi:hypothetical protein